MSLGSIVPGAFPSVFFPDFPVSELLLFELLPLSELLLFELLPLPELLLSELPSFAPFGASFGLFSFATWMVMVLPSTFVTFPYTVSESDVFSEEVSPEKEADVPPDEPEEDEAVPQPAASIPTKAVHPMRANAFFNFIGISFPHRKV